MTKEEYLADKNFANIDAKLRKEEDLNGYKVVSVSRQLVNGNNYEIKYQNSLGGFIIYRVHVSFAG